MLNFSDNYSKKNLRVIHVEGKYEGEPYTSLSLLSSLPTEIYVQNINSPTLKVKTGPTPLGPWTDVKSVKKNKIEEIDRYMTHLFIEFANNKNYDFWFALHK